jgi:hypothetical protein
MKPNLFVLLGAPLNTQNISRCGLPQLRSRFNLITLDCREYLGRIIDETELTKRINNQLWMKYSEIQLIANFSEFTKIYSDYKPLYVIDFAGPGEKVRKIQRFVQSKNSKFVVHELGKFPQLPIYKRFKQFSRMSEQTAESRSVKSDELKLVDHESNKERLFFSKTLKQIFQTRFPTRPDIAVVAGGKAVRYEVKRSRNHIRSNSFDAHAYKTCENPNRVFSENFTKKEYDVFIDDCISMSPTGKMLGWDMVSPQTYFHCLNEFFMRRQFATGREIVICGHPNSSHIPQYQENFDGRMYYLNSTLEIVKSSHTVLAHGSTAISFAVLASKPIVFLTSSEIDKSVMGPNISLLSKKLGAPLVSIDTEQSEEHSTPMLDLGKRHKFRSNFLEFKSSDLTNPWSRFIECIDSIL